MEGLSHRFCGSQGGGSLWQFVVRSPQKAVGRVLLAFSVSDIKVVLSKLLGPLELPSRKV